MRAVVIGGAAATGAAAFVYEIAWTRLLAITLGASTYAFTIMLAAFIGGIAIGARLSASRRLARPRDPVALFGRIQIALAAAVVLTLPLADYLPYAFKVIRDALAQNDAGFALFQGAQLLLCLGAMAVSTILGGLALPLAARAVAATEAPGRAVATSFGANTAGSLVGALAAGLALLPLFGVRHTFTVGIALNLLAGAAAIAVTGSRLARVVAPAAAIALLWTAAALPALERGSLTLQIFRPSRRAEDLGTLEQYRSGIARRSERIVYDRDGATGTVAVIRSRDGVLTLLINGKPDASTSTDVRTQLLIAHLPLLLKPDAKDVLLVGLGSGMTAGSMLRHPIERLEIVELVPEVVEASRLFDKETHAPLRDPRTRLVVDDARTALRLSRRQYDVILSEPSNPWVAGVGSLFTREHFQAIAARLKPGGIAAQWMQTYEISNDLVEMVVRTFLAVFPHVRIFAERGQSDVFLVGATEPWPVDLDALAARFALEPVRQDLARDELTVPEALLALELYGPQEAPRVPGPGPLNLDDRPLLEFEAPRALFKGGRARWLLENALAPERPPSEDRLLESWIARRPPTEEVRAAVKRYLGRPPRQPWAELEDPPAPGQLPRTSRLRPPGGAK